MSRSTDALNRSLENQMGAVNSAFDPGLEALGVGTRAAINTAKGYNAEAQNYLGQGLNMARGDVRANADQALRYLDGAMQGMQPMRSQDGLRRECIPTRSV
ncbi:MAG: hypothetical protein HZY79_02230 [Rhodoblastus sp.]|nr:MAG: hypothetical protein HZY79_02230 [Rhodoblastus sp.]